MKHMRNCKLVCDGFACLLKTAVNADDYDLEHKLPGVICALDGCEKSEIRRQRNKDDWQGVAM
jgi:hypothetical protein